MIKELKARALHYQLKEEFTVVEDAQTMETSEGEIPIDGAPIEDVVSGYVMDTWPGDPALQREQVRDAAVGLL
ncbi:MAG: hypothetical protein IH987_01330 [Planctomycetes bacterium]|nr:hypothetical protein [Planctomycetota bacterium]